MSVATPRHGVVHWSWRVVQGRPFLFVSVLCGLAVAPLLPAGIKPATRAIIAWDVGVIAYLALSAYLFITERLDRMAADAAAQEEGEWTIFWLTVAAVAFSFAAIISAFADTRDLPPAQRGLHVALVAVTLLVSWLMTHTTFAFRYAHEYYEAGPDGADIAGGLDFPGEKRPDYLDFLYFSLVLGMTFQVSDVDITARKFRRLAAAHGLLSFLFNTIILALTVNIAAGLL
jgi:uncharacterized membrane protein